MNHVIKPPVSDSSGIDSRMHDLRNRIGHHHRIWSLDLDARWKDLVTLARWIDPVLRAWIETNRDVPAALTVRIAL